MTEKITLELTLEELKLIDKHLWISVATKPILEKIKNAYPKQRMELERTGKVSVVFYDKKTYYRIEYGDEFHYTVWWRRSKQDTTSQLSMITDKETERLLEGIYFNDVKKGVIDEPDWYDEVEWDEKDNPKPAEEVFDRLEDKYEKYGGTSYFTDEVIDSLLKKWESNPPAFASFYMGTTLEKLIERWWSDVFCNIDINLECIADLCDRVEKWLPAEQSAEGSQDTYAIVAVDAENALLQKIKSKLRNRE